MKKTILFLCFILIVFGALSSCQKKEPKNSADHELEMRLIGKWKFLYTDAPEEQTPPKNLSYTLTPDHISLLEFTDENNEEKTITGTYEVSEGKIKFFKEEKLSKEFQVEFLDQNTLRFTDGASKNSMVLGRVQE
ncbi:MAG: lipocalin family protein [bacterium]